MSADHFEQFRTIVLGDEALQAKLQSCAITNRFVAEVVRLAEACGLAVEVPDVEHALRDARKSWLERWI